MRRSTSESDNAEVFESSETVNEYAKSKNEQGLFGPEQQILDEYYRSADTVLILGCGTGRVPLALEAQGIDCINLDISQGMVETARDTLTNSHLFIADAATVPIRESSVDHVMFPYNGVDYIHPESRRLEVINEAHRVVKPNGTFSFSSHNAIGFIPMHLAGLKNILLHHLRWLLNGELFRSYRNHKISTGCLKNYRITPFAQRRQLSDSGFELKRIFGRHNNTAKYFEPWPYYVAVPK
jgi:SAM-dependent methyltransferase